MNSAPEEIPLPNLQQTRATDRAFSERRLWVAVARNRQLSVLLVLFREIVHFALAVVSRATLPSCLEGCLVRALHRAQDWKGVGLGPSSRRVFEELQPLSMGLWSHPRPSGWGHVMFAVAQVLQRLRFMILLARYVPGVNEEMAWLLKSCAIVFVEVVSIGATRMHRKLRSAWRDTEGSLWPCFWRGLDIPNVLYVIASLWSVLVYGGSSDDARRRWPEHDHRIMNPEGVSQQRFYEIFRLRGKDRFAIAWALSTFWLVSFAAVTAHRLVLVENAVNSAYAWALNDGRVIMTLRKLNAVMGAEFIGGAKVMRFGMEGASLSLEREGRLARFTGGDEVRATAQVRRTIGAGLEPLKERLRRIANELCRFPVTPLGQRARADTFHLSANDFLYVLNRVNSAKEGGRVRAREWLRRVADSRNPPWKLPRRVLQISVPWLGQTSFRTAVRKHAIEIMDILESADPRPLPRIDLPHPRLQVSWRRSGRVQDLVRTAPAYRDSQHSIEAFPCVCQNLPDSWPRTPCVHDGLRHVCCSQSEAPWPVELEWFRSVTCSAPFAPSPQDAHHAVVSSVFQFVESLGCSLNDLSPVAEVAERLANLGTSALRTAPSDYQTEKIAQVRKFLQKCELWTETTDKDQNKLQMYCPRLAWFVFARAFEFGPFQSDESHFRFYDVAELAPLGFTDVAELIAKAAVVPNLADHLQPGVLAGNRKASWDLAHPRGLPKNSNPSEKMRPITDRSSFPTHETDRLGGRAGDFALSEFPVELHCDVPSPQAVRDIVTDFNRALPEDTPMEMVSDAEDMVGAFTNIPHAETPQGWEYLVRELKSQGRESMFVPRSKEGPGKPFWRSSRRNSRQVAPDGYVEWRLEDITALILHHLQFAFAWFGCRIMQEIEGFPMGSGFAPFLMKMWCVVRELYFSRTLDTEGVLRRTGARWTRHLFFGIDVFLLEMRYFDDCESIAAFPGGTNIREAVRLFLKERRSIRYRRQNGRGVSFEEADPGLFVGLQVSLGVSEVHVRPDVVQLDPRALWGFRGRATLQSSEGFHPPNVHWAIFSGLLARCLWQSSSAELAAQAAFEYCLLLLGQAKYQEGYLGQLAKKWDTAHPHHPFRAAATGARELVSRAARQILQMAKNDLPQAHVAVLWDEELPDGWDVVGVHRL